MLPSPGSSDALIRPPNTGGIPVSSTVKPQLVSVVFVSVTVEAPRNCRQRLPSRIVAPDRSATPDAATRIPYQSDDDGASLDERKVMFPAPA